jgi:hypothetical protein
MSLNKFFDTNTGFNILKMNIGADEVKCNNIDTTNINTTTINGVPPVGGVQNPLTENLKLGGFAIVEEIGLSPSLNIDQLDNTKDIKLKIAGISKVDVKDNEISFNENINMNQNQINDVSLITNTAPLGLVGQSGTSAVVLDPDPSNSFNVLGQSDIKLQTNTDVILQSNTGFIDLNSNITRVNVGGITKLQVDGSETTSSNNINMGDNEIQNLGKITSSSNLTLTPNNNVICSTDLDMSNNQIDNVSRVDSGLANAILNLVGRDRVDIGIGGGGRMEIEDTRVLISQFANLDIQSKIIYVQPNTMPSGGVFFADTTYIFVGSRTTSTSFTLPTNCKIMGTGKNNSTINYTGAGSLFTTTDNNLDIENITLTSSNNAGILLTASNLGQDKTINLTRLQIRNAKNGMNINGYDLVDLNNCLFTFFESGSPSPIGISFGNNSKVQLSSCEFLRWFQEGGTPSTTFFNGDMLKFGGILNALNINGCFFHPQYDQNGINTTFITTAIEGTITSNTFIDINLNTPTFNVLVVNPIIAPIYVIEGNSIYPNLKSQVSFILTAVNTTATDLSVNNPNVINTNNLALPLVAQFATLGTNGLITYTKKRSGNFMIVATCNIELVSGTNNRIGLGLFVNGAEVPLAYSYINLSASGSANQKSATFSFTGQANLNDTFQLSVFNATTNNNVIVNDINFAGIEI